MATIQSGAAPHADRGGERSHRAYRFGKLTRDAGASLTRVVIGFLFAAAAGVALGTLMGRSRTLDKLLDPALELMRPIPPLAFLPVFVLWFGIGEASKIAFITYSAFFPIFTTTMEGIKFVDIRLIRAAQTLRASEGEIFLRVVLPAALPSTSPASGSDLHSRCSSSWRPNSSPPIRDSGS